MALSFCGVLSLGLFDALRFESEGFFLFQVFHHISIFQTISEFSVVSADAYAGDYGDFIGAEFFLGDALGFLDQFFSQTDVLRRGFVFFVYLRQFAIGVDFADEGGVLEGGKEAI